MPRRKTLTPCLEPGCPTLSTSQRCSAHTTRGKANASPSSQAQNAEYTRLRAALLKPGPDGTPPPCHWCGRPATTADHLIPVSAGGQHEGNLVPACAPCNYGRQDRPGPPPPQRRKGPRT